MSLRKLLIATTILSISFKSFSQSNSLIPGIWKGPSICQVKNSPCHDEIAVYHVSKADSQNVFHFLMNKLVDGKEDEMGTLSFTYNSSNKTLTSINKANNSKWEFKLTGVTMEGTLYYKNNLYRIIKLKREE